MANPKYKWRETFKAIEEEYKKHDGKRFEVLEDITDPAIKDDPEYGYVRTYKIRLDDGTIIDALEAEVEWFPEVGE